MFATLFPRRMTPSNRSGLATIVLMVWASISPASAWYLSLRRLTAINAVSAPEKKKDRSRKKKSSARYRSSSCNSLRGSLDRTLVGGGQRPIDLLLHHLLAQATHRCHLADNELLGTIEHALLAKRQTLLVAEIDEVFENLRHLKNGTGAHLLTMVFVATFPVGFRLVEILLQKFEKTIRVGPFDDFTQT